MITGKPGSKTKNGGVTVPGAKGERGLQKLKERESMLDESKFMDLPSEKGLLRAMILRIEDGIDGVKKYFLSDEGYEIVKYATSFCYGQGYNYKEDDVELLCFVLENSISKSTNWIKKLDGSDYNVLIYFKLERIYKRTGNDVCDTALWDEQYH